MKYGLSSIGLNESTITGSRVDKLETIFNAMENQSELLIHVNSNGNISLMCPETRGVLRISKLDTLVANIQFTARVSGSFYSGTFVKTPKSFSDWVRAMSPVDEDYDDAEIEAKIADIEAAIGNISFVHHYGGTIVDILNKYTRQVLVDSSTVANKILLENYYGNIEDISYDTPLTVQVSNTSVNGTAAEIKFIKEVYEDLVLVNTINKTYPLKIVDVSGNWDTYRAIAAGDMTKNIFYNVVRREYEVSPGVIEDCFVVIASSGESSITSLGNRISDIESLITNGDTLSITNILTTGIESTTIESTTIETNHMIINNSLTVNEDAVTSFEGGITAGSSSTLSSLIISNTLNLTNCIVALKSNPIGTDLINKAYVDNVATNTINTVMTKFAVGTAAPPATGTAGTFYFQLKD